jgi:hypothetical protein
LRARLRSAIPLAAVLALALTAVAYGIVAEVGPTFVSTTVNVQPRELPKKGNAPITLTSVTRVGTKDGSTPPTLQTLQFLIDGSGTVDTKGLPVCTLAKLAEATPSQARRRCAGALVGKGVGKALVTMPNKAPFMISSPLSFFNGPPSGGRPTVIVHAYERVPAPKALLVPFTIERVSRGRYGYHVKVDVPEIAGGFGAPILAEATVGATRMRHGRKVGYINAHCVGGRLQVSGNVRFTNGDFFPTTLTSPCHFPR